MQFCQLDAGLADKLNCLQLFTHRLGRLKALQPVERRTFVAAMLLLPLAGLGLRLFGLARMQTLLRVKRPLAQASASLLEIQSMGKLVNMAAKQSPFPATCLTRSTLLAWMLARRGIPCQLRIGVKLDEGAFAAHAWVEWQGIPVNDKPDIATRFHAFESPEPPSAFQTS